MTTTKRRARIVIFVHILFSDGMIWFYKKVGVAGKVLFIIIF